MSTTPLDYDFDLLLKHEPKSPPPEHESMEEAMDRLFGTQEIPPPPPALTPEEEAEYVRRVIDAVVPSRNGSPQVGEPDHAHGGPNLGDEPAQVATPGPHDSKPKDGGSRS